MVLYEVFLSYGYVEDVIRCKRLVDFHACIKIYSRRDARRAFYELQRKCVYDDCCELELWLVQSRNLPSCGAYEANLVTISLKSKNYEVASYDLPRRCPGA